MSLLGIDVGTSSCKATVFSADGETLASGAFPYVRHGERDGGAELDPSVFWEAFQAIVRRVAGATVEDRIEALAISAHGETIIPVDSKGNACGPALLNCDNRSGPMIQKWEHEFGRERIYTITGMPVHAMYSLPKLLWLRESNPEVFQRAKRYVTVTDYLLMQMGLAPMVDYTMASRTMGFDINRLKWSEELLSFVGLTPDNFSEALPSGTVAGRLDADHARVLTLDENVIVVLGGHDQPCGALGAGGIDDHCAIDSAGSYECVTLVTEGPRNRADSLRYFLNTYPHVVKGKYVVLAFFPSGLVIDWFVKKFCLDDCADRSMLLKEYDVLQRHAEAMGREPTGICVTPHLLGSDNPHWDVRATLSASGLRACHTRYHFFRALYEGIACELDQNLRILEKTSGPIKDLVIFGGNSQWDCGVQIRADLTAKTIEREDNFEPVCRGAAMLAGIGAGVYRDFGEAVAATGSSRKHFVPARDMTRRYALQVRRYAALYEGLHDYRSIEDPKRS